MIGRFTQIEDIPNLSGHWAIQVRVGDRVGYVTSFETPGPREQGILTLIAEEEPPHPDIAIGSLGAFNV